MWHRVRAILRRRRVEAELNEELDFHILMQARKHEAAGMFADEALRAARLEFGNLELVKEDARDVRGLRGVEDVLADIKYAIRGLLQSPGFSLAVVLTIGVGVGLNASVFAIFNAYVLRPFDTPNPHSLFSVQWVDRSGHVRDFTQLDLSQLSEPSPALSDVAGYRTFSSRIGGAPVAGDAVTPNYFRMTGVRPALGRTLVPSDAYASVVVLGYAAWQNGFGADSNIIGRIVSVRGAPFRIVGVAQTGFTGFFKKPRDFWIPLAMLPRVDETSASSSGAEESVSALVRLAPDVSASQARAVLESTLQNMTATLPDSARAMRVFLTSRATAIEPSVGAFLKFAPLALVFALILLLACANVANMLLARGLARQRELATRLALGADRNRLIRQLLTEAVVLSLPAVALGFVVASLMDGLGVRALYATLPPDLIAFVRLLPLHADWRVLGFALVASIAASFAFGLLPAAEATRLSLVDAIRGNVAGRSPSRLRGALIVGQVTVASLLLTIGGVLVHEAARLGQTDTGLHTRDIVSIELQDRSRQSVLDALRARPNVDGLAGAASLPLDMRFPMARVVGSDSTQSTVFYNLVTAGYFELLKIGLVAGRMFTPEEEKTAAPSVLVSESAARQLWPGRNPIGRVVRFETKQGRADPITRYQSSSVIGVVRDVAVNSVEEGRARPVFYFPQALTMSGCCILARVHGEPAAAKRALDEALEAAVPGAIDRVDLLNTFVVGAVYPYRVAYCVALGLGLLALGLTVIGVYGVVGYVTRQRIREIGIRIALGARTAEVMALIVKQSFRQAIVGATIGAVIAFAMTRVLASTIQNLPTFDFVAFVGGFSTAVVACLVAALIPSLRAARVDPTVALRRD